MNPLSRYIASLPYERRVQVSACIRKLQSMLAQMPEESVLAMEYAVGQIKAERAVCTFDKETK